MTPLSTAPITTDHHLPPCPRCSATETTPILYGLPTHEVFEASERGEIRLGGCIIGPEAPEMACASCGTDLPWVLPD